MAKGRKAKPPHKRGAASASSAASLLQGGFVGFDAFAVPAASDIGNEGTTRQAARARATPGVAPSAFYTGSNSELAAVFKIVAKKDKTTKAKGLQSLIHLLSTQLSAAEIRQCLPHWLYLHPELQGNNDRLVREYTAAVVAVLVDKVPKAMRKNKSYILPVWIQAAFDPDVEVSRRNREALAALYGDDGAVCAAVSEAWEEILAALLQCFKQRSDKASDVVDRDERRKTSSLRVVAYFSDIGIDDSCLKECLPKPIWQLCKNKSAPVRLECYRLLAYLCKRRRQVVDVKIVAPVVCSALGKESDMPAVALLWDVVLALLRAPNTAVIATTSSSAAAGSEAFWAVVPYRKSFFPQLWTFLSGGVGGAGDKVYPNLLPFVALIPEDVLTDYASDGAPLVEAFFDKLWEGESSPDVGAHNVPFLIRAVLECAAFLYGRVAALTPSAGDAVGVLHRTCVRVVRFYLEEPLQFKRGTASAFTDALKLVLKQIEKHLPEKDTGMPAFLDAMYSVCEECFDHSPTTANRVVDLLASDDHWAQVRLKLLKHQLQQPMVPMLAATAVLAVHVDMKSLSTSEKDRLIESLHFIVREGNEQVMRAALHVVDADADAWTIVLKGLENDLLECPNQFTHLAKFLVLSSEKAELWEQLRSSKQIKSLTDSIVAPSPTLCEDLERDEGQLDVWVTVLRLLLTTTGSRDFDVGLRAKMEAIITSVMQANHERMPTGATIDIHIAVELIHAGHAPHLIPMTWFAIVSLQQIDVDESTATRLKNLRQKLVIDVGAQSYLEERMRELLRPKSVERVDRASRVCAELILSQTSLLSILCDAEWWDKGSTVASRSLEELTVRVPPGEFKGQLRLPDDLPWKALRLNTESTALQGLVVSERRYLLNALLRSEEDTEAFQAVANVCSESTILDDFVREDLARFVVERGRFDLWKFFSPAITRTGVDAEIRREVAACAKKLNGLIPSDLMHRCRSLLDSHQQSFDAKLMVESLAEEPKEPSGETNLSVALSEGESVSHRIETGVFVQARVVKAPNAQSEDVVIEFKRGSGEMVREHVRSSAIERSFSRDEAVVYVRSGKQGKVVMVHSDDPKYPPYYTIQVGSQEIQTMSKWLRRGEKEGAAATSEPVASKPSSGPSSLAHLQKLLADARRAGDHKESLRLMKLLPEFTPKPVDTEAVKAEKLTKEKKKREKARQQMKHIKAHIRQNNLESIATTPKTSTDAILQQKLVDVSSDTVMREVPLGEVAKLARGISDLTGKWRDVAEVRLSASEITVLRETCVLLSLISPLTVVARAAGDGTQANLLINALNIAMNLGCRSQFHALPSTTQSYFARLVLVGVSRAGSTDELERKLMLSSLRLVDSVLSVDTTEQQHILREALPDAFIIFTSTTEAEVKVASASLLQFLPPGFFVEDESRLGELLGVLSKGVSCRRVEAKVCEAYLATLTDPAMMEHLYETYQGLPPSLEAFFTDCAQTITFQKMLVWVLVLRTLRKLYLLFTETREHCTSWLQDRGILQQILSTAFAILGAMRVGDLPEFGTQAKRHGSEIEPKSGLAITDAEILSAYETGDARALALGVVLRTLRVLPALSRQFCNDTLDRTDRASVMKLVRERISPRIVEEEVEEIRRAVEEGAFDSAMEIHASARNGSIVTTYEKDGCALEMGIRLSDCHPVVLPTCECTKQVGVTQSRWRRWVIQIVSLLSHQDGSVLDAVFLFKQNLDKEFEGAEPCPICYCVIHVQDHSMPRLACKTCSNKFHSKCIAKWFSTSHKNECPLCKQPF